MLAHRKRAGINCALVYSGLTKTKHSPQLQLHPYSVTDFAMSVRCSLFIRKQPHELLRERSEQGLGQSHMVETGRECPRVSKTRTVFCISVRSRADQVSAGAGLLHEFTIPGNKPRPESASSLFGSPVLFMSGLLSIACNNEPQVALFHDPDHMRLPQSTHVPCKSCPC